MEDQCQELGRTLRPNEHGQRKLSRRRFLLTGSVAALTATAAGVGACVSPAPGPTPAPTAPAPTPEGPSPGPTAAGTPSPRPTVPSTPAFFFNSREAAAVRAIAGRIIPGTAQDPGAAEAGADAYIDRQLGGAYSDQQTTYRQGLAAVDAYAQSRFQNRFVDLSTSQQDQILTDMDTGTATGFTAPAAKAFLGLLIQHVREGTFADPAYGGNRDMAGWRMIGFPGAQFAYGAPQMAIGADQGTIAPIDLATEQQVPAPMPTSGF